MATAKKIVSKKVTPVRPATRRPIAARATGVQWLLGAKIAVAVAAFCIPLSAGTWTPDRWEIHKLIALLAAVTVAWFCYFVHYFRRPMMSWTWHPLDWLVLAVGAVSVVGTFTSLDWWTSLTGLQGSYVETLPAILGFLSVYFLSTKLFITSADRLVVWSSLLGGIGLALLVQLFQFSGFSVLPASLANDPLFSPLANSSLQVALLASVVATIGLLLWPKAQERWAKVSVIALVALGWLVMLFIGQAVAWATFALGMIVVVINQARRPQTNSNVVIAAVALAAVGMLGQMFNVQQYTSVPSTSEATLGQTVAAQTAFRSIADRPVLGTGPNTWFQAFVEYRPESYNSDPRWGSRFLRSGAEWSQQLATNGIVGFTSWIGILAIAGWEFWRRLRRGYSFTIMTGLFIIALLAVSGMVTTWSFTLVTVAWFTLGLGRAKLAESETRRQSGTSFLPMVGFAITVIVAVVVWYPAVNIYRSQMVTARAQEQMNTNAKSADIIATLERATRIDTRNLDASILLANAYAYDIQNQLDANDVTKAQERLTAAMSTIRTAVVRHQRNPVAYEAENNLLNGLATYIPKPEEQANANFAALRGIEPSNPVHDVGYGQTLQVMRARAVSDTTTTTSDEKLASYLNRAISAYDEALRKKSDYLQAKYARADAYTTAGKYQSAVDDLDALTAAAPTISVFWTAKGTALAKLDKLDMAIVAFEQALAIDATDVNAYLVYSDALQAAKKTTEAIAVLDRGLTAVPSDTELQAAKDKLKA